MNGFTLIETLVAASAMAALALLSLTVVQFSADEASRQEKLTETVTDVLRAHAILSADLTQAAPRRARRSDGVKPQTALEARSVDGEGIFLTFVRGGWERPLREPRPALQAVAYRLSEGRVERGSRERIDGPGPFSWSPVLEGVDGVIVDFYENGQWSPGWAGSPERPLPRALRLTVRLASDAGEFEHVAVLPGGLR